MSRPLNLAADGDLVDLRTLKVKIADFGKGLLLSYKIDKQRASLMKSIDYLVTKLLSLPRFFWI